MEDGVWRGSPRLDAVSRSVGECILDSLFAWARSGFQTPREIVLSGALYRRLESELGAILSSHTALTGDAIIIQGPTGPVRITKEATT